MTIRIEPHYRVQIHPNVGAAQRDDDIVVFAELENLHPDTISSANLVAVAYSEDGTLLGVEESSSYVMLREGEKKALKLRLEVEFEQVEALRLYVETEFDEDDPASPESALADPPRFMNDYFKRKHEKPDAG